MSAPPAPLEQVAHHSRTWLLAMLPLGFLLGLAGGFLHESRVFIGELQLPWGSVLVIATLLVAIRALSLNLATRLAGGLFYSGWVIATALLALPNPSRDVVFSNDLWSWGYLLAGSLLGAAAAAWPLFLNPSPHGSPPAGQLPEGQADGA